MSKIWQKCIYFEDFTHTVTINIHYQTVLFHKFLVWMIIFFNSFCRFHLSFLKKTDETLFSLFESLLAFIFPLNRLHFTLFFLFFCVFLGSLFICSLNIFQTYISFIYLPLKDFLKQIKFYCITSVLVYEKVLF